MNSPNNSSQICPKCGSEMVYSPTDSKLVCQSCSHSVAIESQSEHPDKPLTPDAVIPATINPNDLSKHTRAYMVTGDHTPDDLVLKANITKQWIKYVPFYRYRGRFEATWTASFGYDREETYTDYETRHENNRSYKVPVTKTRTVTDWRPVNGTAKGSFDVIQYAGTGLDAKAVTLIDNIDMSGAVPFNEKYTAGFNVEKIASSPSDCMSAGASSKINVSVAAAVKSHAQGNRQKDWHWNPELDLKSVDVVLLPIAHNVFEHEGTEYNVYIDGTDHTRVIGDDLPVDQKSKSASLNGWIPLGIYGFFLAMFTFVGKTSVLLTWWNGLALVLVLAHLFWRDIAIKNYRQKVRANYMTQVNSADEDTSGKSEAELDAIAKSMLPVSSPPFVADTSKDIYVLPIVALISVLLSAVPLMTTKSDESFLGGADNQALAYKPGPQSQETTSQQNQLQQPQAQSAGDSKPNLEERQVSGKASNTPSQSADLKTRLTNAVSSIPVSQSTNYIGAMLKGMGQGDIPSVDAAYNSILQLPKPQKGDRKLAREVNEEGLALLKSKNYGGSVDKFITAVSIDPSDQEIVNNLGYALVKANLLDEGAYILFAALTLNPGRSSAWFNLGEDLALQNNPNGAVKGFMLGYKYSKNQQKSLGFMQQVAADPSTDPKVASALNTALKSIQ